MIARFIYIHTYVLYMHTMYNQRKINIVEMLILNANMRIGRLDRILQYAFTCL